MLNKIKVAIFVFVLVGIGGSTAFWGFSTFYKHCILDSVNQKLASADIEILNHLKVQTFTSIQTLMGLAGSDEIINHLEVTKSTSPLESIRKANNFLGLMLLSGEGVLMDLAGEGMPVNTTLTGLPAVEECIQGVARDGIYEIGKNPMLMAFAPVKNSRGKNIGCLGATEPLNLESFSNAASIDTAVLLRDSVTHTTAGISPAQLKPLFTQLDAKKILFFGRANVSPWFAGLEDSAFAAKPLRLPSGTDGLYVSAIFSLQNSLALFHKAQNRLLMGIAAFLFLGLVVGFFLFGKTSDKQLGRLHDAVDLLSNGGANTIESNRFHGLYRKLAENILRLSGPKPVSAATTLPSNGTISQVLKGQPTPVAPTPSRPSHPIQESSGMIDFENLLSEEPSSSPAISHRPQTMPPQAQPVMPPAHSIPSPSQPPVPSQPTIPPGPPIPTQANSGPKVDLPDELADFFNDSGIGDAHLSKLSSQASKTASPPRVAQPTQAIPPATTPDSDIYQSDATVVAQIPDELLRASSVPVSDFPSPTAPMPEPLVPTPAPFTETAFESDLSETDEEEAHFREVFEKFLSTKQQCGESVTGITYDRFVEKLQKNIRDLKSRFHCKTVRFQVYVKSGKAALKATPIK